MTEHLTQQHLNRLRADATRGMGCSSEDTLKLVQMVEQQSAAGYIFDHGHDGRRFSKKDQVRFVGNSVSPPPMAALIRANLNEAQRIEVAA